MQSGFNSRNDVGHRPRGGDLFLFRNNEKLKLSESSCSSEHAGPTGPTLKDAWPDYRPFVKEQTVTVYNAQTLLSD